MSTETSKAVAPPASPKLIAPHWHTAVLIAILLAISSLSARFLSSDSPQSGGSKVPLYLSVIVSEWALVYFAVAGVRRSGMRLKDLLGHRWDSPLRFFADLAIAAVFFIVGSGFLRLLHTALYAGHPTVDPAANVLPHGTAETITFALVSITAGICEEIVFRGYLQRQLGAIGKSAAIGIIGQAIIFGISHGYQGLKQMVIISAYGILFGLLAHWRKSLIPGIVAHAWQDVFSGIIARG